MFHLEHSAYFLLKIWLTTLSINVALQLCYLQEEIIHTCSMKKEYKHTVLRKNTQLLYQQKIKTNCMKTQYTV